MDRKLINETLNHLARAYGLLRMENHVLKDDLGKLMHKLENELTKAMMADLTPTGRKVDYNVIDYGGQIHIISRVA